MLSCFMARTRFKPQDIVTILSEDPLDPPILVIKIVEVFYCNPPYYVYEYCSGSYQDNRSRMQAEYLDANTNVRLATPLERILYAGN